MIDHIESRMWNAHHKAFSDTVAGFGQQCADQLPRATRFCGAAIRRMLVASSAAVVMTATIFAAATLPAIGLN